MKQVIIKKGIAFAEDVPSPNVSKGNVLIKVHNSCISPGTELIGYKTSKKGLIKRALEQPDNVKKVINMAKSDNILKVYNKIKSKLSGGKTTGYSLSGVVIAAGAGVNKLKEGDRVAAGGAGIANHAEYVDVPQNLVVPIPNDLDFESASTVTLGAIAIQGVRRAGLRIGEFAAVFGVGLIGLLTVQILKSAGVRVVAIDLDDPRLNIAKEIGAEMIINSSDDNLIEKIISWSDGFGVDSVIFTASTSSNTPLSQSFRMCRKKGRVVLVGVSGLQILREDIYEKELDFLISTSYGPGRYDSMYEIKGVDYPYAYVRWTENRNMREYLRLLSNGSINLKNFSLKKFHIDSVEEAFQILENKRERSLSVILSYNEQVERETKVELSNKYKVNFKDSTLSNQIFNIALVGTGNFAIGMHLPNILKLNNNFKLHSIVNRTGYKGKVIAEQYGAKYVTTDIDDVLKDQDVDIILITTRHDSHAKLVLKSLMSKKIVFVEKPLATTENELNELAEFYKKNKGPLLMVGFNRRFSRYAQEIKKHVVKAINPLFINYRMNAGYLPPEHWAHDDGGRIIGEACHIIDLMTFLVGDKIVSISSEELTPRTNYYTHADNKSILLKYKDGSVAMISYFSNGSKNFPKESMEVHFDNKTIIMNDYRDIKGYGVNVDSISTKNSEKGQYEELQEFYNTIIGKRKNWPIELWDMIQTTKVSILLS